MIDIIFYGISLVALGLAAYNCSQIKSSFDKIADVNIKLVETTKHFDKKPNHGKKNYRRNYKKKPNTAKS